MRFRITWSSSKSRRRLFLHFFLAVSLFYAAPSMAADVILGYYPSWVKSDLPAEKIKYEHLTHISHSFAWPLADGRLGMDGDFLYPDLVEAAHRAGVEVVLALGGWGQSDGFSSMAAGATSRSVFIDNIVDMLEINGYDGIDIDWEYPENNSDKNNLNLLVRELRETFTRLDKSWSISLACPASSWSGQWFDFAELAPHMDWFGCMTYDFFGSWSSRAGHNSPLYPPARNDNGSVQSGLMYMNSRGISNEQLLLGIPFYGRGCLAGDYNALNLGEDVSYGYKDIEPLIGNGWTYHWDNTAKVPYLLNDTRTHFISYDDTISVRFKCLYAVENYLKGVMIWALGHDVIKDTQPLLETVGRSMTGTEVSPDAVPFSFRLWQNYPNPFNARTSVQISLDRPGIVSLRIYNIKGQLVRAILSDVHKQEGLYRYNIDMRGDSGGVYLLVLSHNDREILAKMTLLR